MFKIEDKIEDEIDYIKKNIIDSISDKKHSSQKILKDIFDNSDINIDNKLKKMLLMRQSKNKNIINDINDNFKYFTKEDIEEYNNFISDDNNLIKDSEDLFLSFVTMTNWFEELEEHGALGLLASVKTSYLGKVGNADFINFKTTFDIYSAEDYLYSLSEILQKSLCKDINELCVVKDSLKKKCNGLFLLYINKLHWKSAKKFLPIITSCFMSHSPFAFTEDHIKSYFIALVRYGNSIDSEKNFKIFLALWRTCYEIAKDKNYLFGFLKLFHNLVNNFKLRYQSQYEILLGQTLLINNINKKKINKFYQDIYFYLLNSYFSKNNFKDDISQIKLIEFKILIKELLEKFNSSWHVINLIKNIRLRKFLIENLDYKNLPKLLDDNQGVYNKDINISSILDVNIEFPDIFLNEDKETYNIKCYNLIFYNMLNKPIPYNFTKDLNELYQYLIDLKN